MIVRRFDSSEKARIKGLTMRTPFLIATALTLGISGFVWLPSKKPNCQIFDPRVLSSTEVDNAETYSNILPSDYVGSNTCLECHQDQHEAWQTHSHSKMNQLPTEESVRGDFHDSQLLLPTGRVLFTSDLLESGNREYRMKIYQGNPHSESRTQSDLHREYLVTKTVGSRYIQAYIGRQVKGPEPLGHDIYLEHKLPFTYWFKIEQWLPEKFYNIHQQEKLVDGVPQTDALDFSPSIALYTESCMNCHNTFPYAYRIFHKALVGFPDATVAVALDPLAEALSTELLDVQPTVSDMNQLNQRLNPDADLVSLGISCESCHMGGREHALHQRKMKFVPTSKFVTLKNRNNKGVHENRSHAPTLLGTCAQCHSGDGELYPNGSGKSNSREALDFHLGFCTTEMNCVTCHDPHSGSDSNVGALNPEKVAMTCVSCHEPFQTKAARIEHAGGEAHAKVSCLECHMPKYTRGIDELIRTHRITNPIEESMVANGMPNACNACHLDKSTQWALDGLENIWGRGFSPNRSWKSYAELDRPAGEFWLESTDSHTRLIVSQLFEISNRKTPLSSSLKKKLIYSLNDAQRLNRVFSTFTVKRILDMPMNQKLPVDITAAPNRRFSQIVKWLDELELNKK